MVHPDNRREISRVLYQQHQKTNNILNIIALDTSGSTLVSEQLSDAKAVVHSLCDYFYQQRQRIALLCFGNQRYQWLITDSKTPASIDTVLKAIQAGGGTPLREALLEINRYSVKRTELKPMDKQKLFLISDGRSRDKLDDIVLAKNLEVHVLDSENSDIRLNKAQVLATHLMANYVSLFK
ncbi:MAG: VWA domain-containing protein [Cocleimonas sp.]|nr:VWA domain-containing protein [Cocleimonas sp.]